MHAGERDFDSQTLFPGRYFDVIEDISFKLVKTKDMNRFPQCLQTTEEAGIVSLCGDYSVPRYYVTNQRSDVAVF